MFNKEYSQYYDLFNQDKPYKKEIQFVYKWAGKPQSIFDVGCGTACYWKYYPTSTVLVGVERSISMADPEKNITYCDITRYKPGQQLFDCATALFDVVNYISRHDWWKKLPIAEGGFFIFDIWDKKKIEKEGFRETVKTAERGIQRIINPIRLDWNSVDLGIKVIDKDKTFYEKHRLYLHSHEDILAYCGREFEVVDVKETETWQRWYKLRKK